MCEPHAAQPPAARLQLYFSESTKSRNLGLFVGLSEESAGVPTRCSPLERSASISYLGVRLLVSDCELANRLSGRLFSEEVGVLSERNVTTQDQFRASRGSQPQDLPTMILKYEYDGMTVI